MKRLLVLAGLVPAALFAGSLALGQPPLDVATPQGNGGGGSDPAEDQRVDIGYAISPVSLDIEGLNPRLVGLGSYLVNSASACAECHTNPPYADGGNPFMGQPKQINAVNYLAGGQLFGPFVSRNITPQANGMPAGRTFEQFVEVMRHGIDFECGPGDPPPCPLLQVMPWPVFLAMSDYELRAIYEFLSAVPSAEPGVAP